MTIHRLPIRGIQPPKALECVGADCVRERKRALRGRINGEWFQCPGKAEGRCESRSFCYPRYKREDDKLATYLEQRKLDSLKDELQFHFHEGIDLGKMDDPIVSVVRGEVVKVVDVYTKGFSGYGKGVTIQADASYGELGGRVNRRPVSEQPIFETP